MYQVNVLPYSSIEGVIEDTWTQGKVDKVIHNVFPLFVLRNALQKTV